MKKTDYYLLLQVPVNGKIVREVSDVIIFLASLKMKSPCVSGDPWVLTEYRYK